jgi:hypothetical protein
MVVLAIAMVGTALMARVRDEVLYGRLDIQRHIERSIPLTELRFRGKVRIGADRRNNGVFIGVEEALLTLGHDPRFVAIPTVVVHKGDKTLDIGVHCSDSRVVINFRNVAESRPFARFESSEVELGRALASRGWTSRSSEGDAG